MSNFNFRLYGDQIYGLLSGYFKDYISPEINKEQFLSMFKEGKLKYNNISILKELDIYPQICINTLKIQNMILDIPDENEHLKINLNDVLCEASISNISEKQIKVYDIQIFIKKKTKDDKFPIIGYKNHARDNISWTRNR